MHHDVEVNKRMILKFMFMERQTKMIKKMKTKLLILFKPMMIIKKNENNGDSLNDIPDVW